MKYNSILEFSNILCTMSLFISIYNYTIYVYIIIILE